MMVSPIYPGGTYPMGSITYGSNGKKGGTEALRSFGQQYDQVQFSTHLSETEKWLNETTGQIARQVRTRPSGHELDTLRQQISCGTYQVDAREIAARMMLVEEH